MLLRVSIIVIASVIVVLSSQKKEDRLFAGLATCRFGTSAMLSVSANSLVTVENTRGWQVWSTKAYD